MDRTGLSMSFLSWNNTDEAEAEARARDMLRDWDLIRGVALAMSAGGKVGESVELREHSRLYFVVPSPM